jgi:hypothetical protein
MIVKRANVSRTPAAWSIAPTRSVATMDAAASAACAAKLKAVWMANVPEAARRIAATKSAALMDVAARAAPALKAATVWAMGNATS